jgi:hypothetical protein
MAQLAALLGQRRPSVRFPRRRRGIVMPGNALTCRCAVAERCSPGSMPLSQCACVMPPLVTRAEAEHVAGRNVRSCRDPPMPMSRRTSCVHGRAESRPILACSVLEPVMSCGPCAFTSARRPTMTSPS